ncbi:MAG: hypothetical protein J6V38_07825 [Kiritimatiellae bacterium]|nr:hypothetical protein [Kiritimatiellia bacterium]
MSCLGCKHYLGGGCCRMNLESECAAGGFEMYETDMYQYYCKARPPMPGTIPTDRALIVEVEAYDERRYVPEVDCMAWGWVVYDRPLTSDEIFDYELRSAPREVE